MKIISAKEYKGDGFHRKVMVVVENPDDPHWVHSDGKAHTSATAVAANGTVTTGLTAGTQCHACRNNWRTHEETWTNEELYNITVSGEGASKTKSTAKKADSQLSAELKERAEVSFSNATTTSISGLSGSSI